MLKPNLPLESVAKTYWWVFPILTLDVARAFYDLMGIADEFREPLHAALREGTLATRKAMLDALVSNQPKPTLDSFCSQVAAKLGPRGTQHLVWWMQHVLHFEIQDHIPVDHWVHVLRHCWREGRAEWQRLSLPEPLSATAFERFTVSSQSRQRFYQRSSELSEAPASDWDLHMYASQLFEFEDDSSEYGGGMNPMTTISLTVANYESYSYWAWLLRQLTPDQQTALQAKAFEIVQADELTWIKSLVHPSELDIGL